MPYHALDFYKSTVPLMPGTQFTVSLEQTPSDFRVMKDPRDKQEYRSTRVKWGGGCFFFIFPLSHRLEIVTAKLLIEAFWLNPKVMEKLSDQITKKNFTLAYRSVQVFSRAIGKNTIRRSIPDIFEGPMVPSKMTAFFVPTLGLETGKKCWLCKLTCLLHKILYLSYRQA